MILLAHIIKSVLSLTPIFCKPGEGTILRRLIVFQAHSTDLFDKVSLITLHLCLDKTIMLSSSLTKFRYVPIFVTSTNIESQIMCVAPCDKIFPLILEFSLFTFSWRAGFSFLICDTLSSPFYASFSILLIFSFNYFISPSFKLTWDIARKMSSVPDFLSVT